MRFLRSDSRFYGLLQCFFRALLSSCNKKPCIKFSPAFESPCISSLPCIGIPCMGLRAIYVPASVFKFRAKSSCNCILSLCIFRAILHCRICENGSAWFWVLANRLKSFEWCSHGNHASEKII